MRWRRRGIQCRRSSRHRRFPSATNLSKFWSAQQPFLKQSSGTGADLRKGRDADVKDPGLIWSKSPVAYSSLEEEQCRGNVAHLVASTPEAKKAS